ncbi:MAG: T9SS type A sorting domain-containing protein [Flavobacterium sp.]|nr:T9SS type A sorting domain-containing protein [Flavobacterium sp.]
MKKNFLFMLLVLSLIQPLLAQVPSYVPTNGLVGYWPFNGNANDESGNGNNGTVNGAVLTSDRFENANNAYFFDGQNDYISCNPLLGLQEVTISVWLNKNGQGGHLVSQNNWNSAQNVSFGSAYEKNTNVFSVGVNSGNCNFQGSQSFTSVPYNLDSNWHHRVTTINNLGLIRDFIDNQLINSTTVSNFQWCNSTSAILKFGAWWNSDIQSWDGKIDDIGIWNRALTPQEIANLYNSVNSNECLTMVINSGPLSTNPVTYTSTVNIFPNPANDQITIDCGNLANVVGWNIKITNALGQQVFAAPMNTQQYVVPLNSWSGQGMYFVKILNAQNEVVNIKKIILQ